MSFLTLYNAASKKLFSGGALQDRANDPEFEARMLEKEERENDEKEDRDDEESREKAL